MKKARSVFLAFVLGGVTATGLVAQEITVYADVEYGGGSQTYRSAIPNLVAEQWNDIISSVRIPSGSWELCKTESFRDCQTVDRDTADLRRLGLNDQISSLRPVRADSTAGGDPRPAGSILYNRQRSEFAVSAIYQALLGRDPDPQGQQQAVDQFMQGRIEPWIRSVTQSREFGERVAGAGAESTLDQIYRGLLGREMDTSGRDTYLRQIEQRQYADVVLEIMRSSEWRNRLP